jgi:hypothetical protein
MDFDPKLMATIGTSFITSLAAKGITGPAETINDLWKASFGYPIHYFSEKRKIKYEINLKKFEKELTEKILEIPKENIQEPKESIIGPALEASKYYFDEEEIRNMFANLIASSMDSTYNGLIQHSFVEIIKQLSPLDAKLFKSFKKNNPIVDLFYKFDFKKSPSLNFEIERSSFSILENLFFSSEILESSRNYISIENLIKQGLILIDKTQHLVDEEYYKHYYSSEQVLYYKNEHILKHKPFDKEDGKIELKHCILKLTYLGEIFKEICIKDSL